MAIARTARTATPCTERCDLDPLDPPSFCLACVVAIPQNLTPGPDRIRTAVTGVVNAVRAARYDERTDDPSSGLRVDEVLTRVEDADREWVAASDELDAALDAASAEATLPESEIGAARSALALLNLAVAVAAEVAMVRPLEDVDGNPRLADLDLPNWPSDDEAVLDRPAFGDGTVRNPGLVALLYDGTDDDAEAEKPGQIYGQGAVDSAVNTILNQSADATKKVFTGLVVGPLTSIVPLPPGMPVPEELVRWLLEQFGDWGIEQAVDELPGRVCKLVRQPFKRARRLLVKILGTHRGAVLKGLDELLGYGAATKGTQLIAQAMSWVYNTGNVLDRAYDAFNPEDNPLTQSQRRSRSERLKKLEKSNRRWVGPVERLSGGIGPLWAIPIPCGPVPVPAAPAAAIVLLAWVVLLSGDQLDTRHPYPNFWKGVVRRSQGE